MKSTKVIEALCKQIEAGKLDTSYLRANWPAISASLRSDEILRCIEVLGEPIIYCDACGNVEFAVKTKSAYEGAYWVCEDCLQNYTQCPDCRSMVLIDDLGNPTHKHDLPATPGYLAFPVENPLDVYNVDVMTTRKAKFHKTKEEAALLFRRKMYSRDPENIFRNFGVELEVEKLPGGPPDILTRTRNLLDKFAIMKHDGSLSQRGKGGFEIVSMPATLAFHESGVWSEFFKHLGPFFIENPATTGLHIHIGTNTLSPLTIDKIILFVNAAENREFIFGMANRNLLKANPNGRLYANIRSWTASDMLRLKQHGASCPWHPNNKAGKNYYKMVNGTIQYDPFGNPIIGSLDGNSTVVRSGCKCAQGHYNIEHYEAVNLRTHRPTVELRIFRGIVNEQFLYACLEFSDALSDFCTISTLEELHYKNFLDFLKDKTKRYRNLYRLLVNQCWIDPPKDKKNPKPQPQLVYGMYA